VTSFLHSQTIQTLAFWGINAVMAMIIGVWFYGLYRTVCRVADQISPKENRLKLERVPEVGVMAVPTSWYEANFVANYCDDFLLVRFQALGIAFFAPTLVGLVSIMLIWLNFHIGKLQLTDKWAIKYGEIFGDPRSRSG
jgi:hypothetical protein